MTKIQHMKAKAFRGARAELLLDLTENHNSIAVYGDNATGKSTITDALEWFIDDKIEHLTREGCRKEAYRHVLTAGDTECTVEIKFSESQLDGKKSLASNEKTVAYFEGMNKEHIILRHSDIVRFIDSGKTDKRKAIEDIVGYEKLTKFLDAIRQTQGALEKADEYSGAKRQKEALERKMSQMNRVGQIVPDDTAFFEVVNKILNGSNVKMTVSDEKSYDKAIGELKNFGSVSEKFRSAEQLRSFKNSCGQINEEVKKLPELIQQFESAYSPLIQEREKISQLLLNDFLEKGKTIIEDDTYTDSRCPFCRTEYDVEKLQGEVANRLAGLAELKEKSSAADAAKRAMLGALSTVTTKIESLGQSHKEVEESDERCRKFIASAAKYVVSFQEFEANVNTAHREFKEFNFRESLETTLNKLTADCVESSDAAGKIIDGLALSDKDSEIIEIASDLENLKRHVADYQECVATMSIYENQSRAFARILDGFRTEQVSVLQTTLDLISDDVGKFYGKMHPNENADKVRLSIVEEKGGIEFEYSFHGEPVHPPHKYLSESHLNSLGIAFFLASARIFNARARFMVLDDIVTSFDDAHRKRLLQLLREEFKDWQIILLTHESAWFDMIKDEMPAENWLFRKIHHDDTNGILLE